MYVMSFSKIDKNLKLKPALFLKVKVAFTRIIEQGVSVSYGGKFVSNRKTKLAVLSIELCRWCTKKSFRQNKGHSQ